MGKILEKWWREHPYARIAYMMGAIFTVMFFAFSEMVWTYGCILAMLCFALRPQSQVHNQLLENFNFAKIWVILFVTMATVACCILPMDNHSLWNGEIPGHRNQYELMAENLLEGRLHFAYGDESALLALENPYDPAARKASGLPYHWDHAYYDGQYYMYFGIVPVLLLFLPYRVLTGTALTTYCATQVFTAVFIVGVFALFYLLVRKFFPKLPLSVYLALSVAISVMSIWYAAAEPALYCTAITAAMALEIWSLYFFVRGVWCVEKENKQLVFAGIGAALGALVFGCRPPIALANLLVLPMLWVFLKQRKFSRKLLGKMALAALPYVVVAVALMAYNYARFDNPFEFGQKYQLTVADQSQYSLRLDAETLQKLFESTKDNFFFHEDRSETFPYLKTNSVFFNFPILLLGLGAIPGWRGLKKTGLLPLFLFTGITAVVITAVDVLWTPYLLERYRMDIYFLMGIGCFVAFGAWHHRCAPKGKRYLNFTAGALSVCTVVCSFLYYVKTVGVYYPEKVTEVAKLLGLGQ